MSRIRPKKLDPASFNRPVVADVIFRQEPDEEEEEDEGDSKEEDDEDDTDDGYSE